jgi:tetraacyldisaccharide 4'-kinase
VDIIDLRKIRPPDEYAVSVRRFLLPILVPLSGLYAAGMGLWRSLPVRATDPGVPVVSVGSLAVGGTGKTPVCMSIAARFRDLGRRVCILSRGYRRKSVYSPLVVSDGSRITTGVQDAGDEPYMMARRLDGVAVVVGKDRARAAVEARDRLRADLLVLDDGFQVRNLVRQADVLCFDRNSMRKKNSLLPLGSLREGWSALGRRHLVVVLLERGVSPPSRAEMGHLGDAETFFAVRSPPTICNVEGEKVQGSVLSEGRFGLVSGIARPAAFETSGISTGASLPVSVRFGDHHWYSESDADAVRSILRRYGCTGILTTEKDLWKLPDTLREISLILSTQVDFLDPRAFWKNLDDRLGVETCLPKNRTSS